MNIPNENISTYLLEHDGVLVVYTCSFRKYEERVVITSLNMILQPEKQKRLCVSGMHIILIEKERIKKSSHSQMNLLFTHDLSILCLPSIETDTPNCLQDKILQNTCIKNRDSLNRKFIITKMSMGHLASSIHYT